MVLRFHLTCTAGLVLYFEAQLFITTVNKTGRQTNPLHLFSGSAPVIVILPQEVYTISRLVNNMLS